ncbi:MAG: lipopolysaccharide biosynthesis protein [Balneolia bacterium]|nr:lipopolysaccharide biosynthesis protein [Balneolia bacterium]
MKENLTEKTVRSTNWGLGKTLGQNIVAFFSSMVLARLIAPEEFGLLAIAMLFVGLGMIISNQGITPALVQKKDLTDENIRASFLLSLLAGILVFSIIWLLAPQAALFFNEGRAENVIRAIGFIFILNGVSAVGRGLLMRKFRYKPLFFIEVGAFLFGYGAGSITFALMGYGVWSLVWGVLLQYTIMAIAFLAYVRIPVIPVINGGEYGKLFRFGGGVSLLSFLNYSAMNVDKLIIGRFLDSRELGYYSKAFGLMQVPVMAFSYAIGSVSMSAFSTIQHETEKLKRAYLKAVNILFLIVAPLSVIMVISAEYLVLGVYGPDWVGAVEAFRILSIGIIFKMFFGISGSMAKATNNVFQETKRQLVFALSVGGLSLLLIPYGVEGVAASVTIASLIFFILMTQLALRICHATFSEFMGMLKNGFILAILCGGINLAAVLILEYFLPGMNTPLKMLATLGITFVVSLYLFFRLPVSLIGKNRTWLIETYARYLPEKLSKRIVQK